MVLMTYWKENFYAGDAVSIARRPRASLTHWHGTA